MRINYFADGDCDVTRDGWCATHSESDGPTFCLSEGLVDAIRRARFHEHFNHDHWQQAEVRMAELALHAERWVANGNLAAQHCGREVLRILGVEPREESRIYEEWRK